MKPEPFLNPTDPRFAPHFDQHGHQELDPARTQCRLVPRGLEPRHATRLRGPKTTDLRTLYQLSYETSWSPPRPILQSLSKDVNFCVLFSHRICTLPNFAHTASLQAHFDNKLERKTAQRKADSNLSSGSRQITYIVLLPRARGVPAELPTHCSKAASRWP